MTEESREHASDAGDICHICEQVVTWMEHLPPLEVGGPVRCYVNVRFLFPLGPGVRVVNGEPMYSAAWL